MREEIFEMPDTYGKYRVVCQFGKHYMINYAWWGYLQKEVIIKPFLWGKPKPRWVEVDSCWWSKEINSIEELKNRATQLYDENIEMPIRIHKKAMTLK